MSDAQEQRIELMSAGTLARRRGDLVRAEDCYRRAVDLFPDDGEALRALGNVLFELGRTSDAIDRLKMAAAVAPENVRARVAIGDAYRRLNRFAEAVDEYEQAVQIAPDNPHTLTSLASGYALAKRYQEASALIASAKNHAPGSSEVFVEAGRIKRAMGNRRAAVGEYQAALALSPNNAQAARDLGWTHYELKDFSRSRDLFLRLQSSPERIPDDLRGLALSHLKLGDHRAATLILDRIVSWQPAYRPAHLILMWIHLRHGEWKGFRKAFRTYMHYSSVSSGRHSEHDLK